MDFSFVTVPASIVILTVTASWIFFLVSSIWYKQLSPGNLDETIFFSVIIPAHNEEKVIQHIIDAFLSQVYENLEVIVVCHNCTDKTFNIANEVKDSRLKVLKLETASSGKALALNEGLKHAKGDVIVQMDADNTVNQDFLLMAVRYFSQLTIEAIQVRIATKNANFNLLTKLQQLEYEMFGITYWEGRSAIGQSCTIGGTGVMFRRSVLEAVGGWDNELIEDYDLYCKLSGKTIKVMYASDIECYDEKPPYWSTLICQRARWIRGHFAIMKKRIFEQSSIFDFIYMISPLFYVAWYCCSFLAVASLLGANISYWYVPAYTWMLSLIVLYGVFASRLIKRKMYSDLLYLPAYFIFSFHWLIAFLKSLTIKAWSETKTEHGYVTT